MGRWSDLARALPAVTANHANSVIGVERVEGTATALPIGANDTIGMADRLAVPHRPWTEELARLVAMPCPQSLRADRWNQLRADAVAFADKWGATALTLGWDARALFGCSPAFARRLDRDGLLWFLEGRPVVDLITDAAAIGTLSGGRLVYRRGAPDGAVLPWNAISGWESSPLGAGGIWADCTTPIMP